MTKKSNDLSTSNSHQYLLVDECKENETSVNFNLCQVLFVPHILEKIQNEQYVWTATTFFNVKKKITINSY